MKRFFNIFFKTILMLIFWTCLAASVLIFLNIRGELGKVAKSVPFLNQFVDEEGDFSLETIVSDDTATEESREAEAVIVESISYDRYAYQTLDDETKAVYDEMLDCMLKRSLSVTLATLDVDVMKAAYEAIFADYGNIFWVDGYQYTNYSRNDTPVRIEFWPTYTMDKEDIETFQASIDAVAEEWLTNAPREGSDYDKALYVFETLIERVDYDLDSVENQNIISVFINKATVCQGYADAAWYLLDKLGVKSTIITGKANGGSHAWNLVYLDGAYYYMDVTWGNSKYMDADNTETKRVNYGYLAMSSEELFKTHTPTESFPLPDCLSNYDYYYFKNDLYFDYLDKEGIGNLFKASYDAGNSEISVQFSNEDLMNQAVDYFFTNENILIYCPFIDSFYYLVDDYVSVLTIHW